MKVPVLRHALVVVLTLLANVACGQSVGTGDAECAACAEAAEAGGGGGAHTGSGSGDSWSLFDTDDFPPRWRCGTWSDTHGWVHIVADVGTWLAYMAIPLALVLLLRRRRDVPRPHVIALFGAFIVFCGLTHLLEAIMFWWPAYRFMGLVKLLTMVVSVVTAVVLVFELPRFLQLRSPAQLESEVRRRTAELEVARRGALAAADAKARFTANVSHELRTPMTAVIGYAELLAADERLDVRQREALDVILRNGEHLLGVISDVLDLSRSEAGGLPIVPEPTDCAQAVREACLMLAEAAVRKGVELRVEVEPVSERLLVDAGRLRQILINLVGNAIKFTAEGEVCVDARFGPAVAAEPSDRAGIAGTGSVVRTLTVEIRDTGVGMSPQEVERVFDEYTQADASSTRRFGGSGLGLTISRRLAELMQGELVVSASEPGAGTTMRLRVPFAVAPQQPHANDQVTEAIGVGEAPALRDVRVLVVDDAHDNRMLFRASLERAGGRVECAEDGFAAIAAVEQAIAGGDPFDVVLMDVQMPKLDGLAATRRLRARGFAARILALTANATEHDRRRSLEAGCDDHLTKPIRGAELVRAVVAAGSVAARQ